MSEGHHYWWLAGDYGLDIVLFLKVVVTWWIVAFCAVDIICTTGHYILLSVSVIHKCNILIYYVTMIVMRFHDK